MWCCIDCGDDVRWHVPWTGLERAGRAVRLCGGCASAYASAESRFGRLRRQLERPPPPPPVEPRSEDKPPA